MIISKTIHPTTPEVIDGILMQLHEGHTQRFFGLWSVAFNWVHSEMYLNKSESNNTLRIMLKEKLVTTAINGEVDASNCSVVITKRGLKIKNSGGWVHHISKPSFWKISVMNVTTVAASISTVGGFILGVVVFWQANTMRKLEGDMKVLEERNHKHMTTIDSLKNALLKKTSIQIKPDSTKHP